MIINQTNLDILTTGFRASYQNAFGQVAPQWKDIASLIPSSTRENAYAWLGQFPMLREWVGDRQIQSVAEWRSTADETVIGLRLTTANGFLVNGGANGTLAWAVPEATMASVPPGVYAADLLALGDGDVINLFQNASMILATNPGLAALGPVLPLNTTLVLPTLAPAPAPQIATIQLFA